MQFSLDDHNDLAISPVKPLAKKPLCMIGTVKSKHALKASEMPI